MAFKTRDIHAFMLNLKTLSNENLLSQTLDLVKRERELAAQILWHLREIEARKLFASLGYSSLFEYAVKELRYSDGAAMRRINAMRLLREIPEVEDALKNGSLTISHLSSAQSFFRAEEKTETPTIYTSSEKQNLVLSLQGKSRREADKVFTCLSPEYLAQSLEKIKVVTETSSKLETVVDQRVLDKLERIRQLASHKLKSQSMAELIEFLADLGLEKLEVKKPKTITPPAEPEANLSKPDLVSSSRYIPVEMRRRLLDRAQHRCELVDAKSKHRCEAKRFLQVDHIVPLALGGKTNFENLRILCSTHNQWAATQYFGINKMQGH